MNKTQKQNGITLIALIITIIVMLILVAVTLVITLGENGIIAKAREAKVQQANRTESENLAFSSEDAENKINAVVDGGTWDINTSGKTGETEEIKTGVLYAPFATTLTPEDEEDICRILGIEEFSHSKNYKFFRGESEQNFGYIFVNGKVYEIPYKGKDGWESNVEFRGAALVFSGNQILLNVDGKDFVIFNLVDGCLMMADLG